MVKIPGVCSSSRVSVLALCMAVFLCALDTSTSSRAKRLWLNPDEVWIPSSWRSIWLVLAEWERWGSQRPKPVVAYAEIWKVRTRVEVKR